MMDDERGKSMEPRSGTGERLESRQTRTRLAW